MLHKFTAVDRESVEVWTKIITEAWVIQSETFQNFAD